MNHRPQGDSTRILCLTEEEALALLEICLHSKAEDDALKGRVMEKVGDVCREFIKAGGPGSLPSAAHGDRSAVRDALDALIHRRCAVDGARA